MGKQDKKVVEAKEDFNYPPVKTLKYLHRAILQGNLEDITGLLKRYYSLRRQNPFLKDPGQILINTERGVQTFLTLAVCLYIAAGKD